MPNESKGYRVAKTLTGKHLVHYNCPRCNAGLKNPIEQAGATDKCPNCNASFTVPGRDEAAEILFQLEVEKQSKIESREEKRKQQETEKEYQRIAKRQAAAPPSVSHPKPTGPNPIAVDNPIKRTLAEWLLVGIALLEFFSFNVLVTVPMLASWDSYRFHDDNAMGATANALEWGLPMLASWLNFIAVILIFVYVKLRQSARMQAELIKRLSGPA